MRITSIALIGNVNNAPSVIIITETVIGVRYGHWVESFFDIASKTHAILTAEFLINRVEYAVTIQSCAFRPCNYGPYKQVPPLSLNTRMVNDYFTSYEFSCRHTEIIYTFPILKQLLSI